MKKKAIALVILLFIFILTTCKKEIDKPVTQINTDQEQSNDKSIYITLKKTQSEIRNNEEIIVFLNKRINGAGLKGKINNFKDLFEINIPISNIDNSLKKMITDEKNKAREYFKELLEQKIEITLQQVDSSYIDNLPPFMIDSGGDYFGKVIPAKYKYQVRAPADSDVYPVLGSNNQSFLVIKRTVLIKGEHILKAKMERVKNKPWILIQFSEEGAKRFSYYTRSLIQERLAVLVNGWVLAAPVVSEHIPDGETWIAGKMTEDKALQLAGYFNASGGYGITLENIIYK